MNGNDSAQQDPESNLQNGMITETKFTDWDQTLDHDVNLAVKEGNARVNEEKDIYDEESYRSARPPVPHARHQTDDHVELVHHHNLRNLSESTGRSPENTDEARTHEYEQRVQGIYTKSKSVPQRSKVDADGSYTIIRPRDGERITVTRDGRMYYFNSEGVFTVVNNDEGLTDSVVQPGIARRVARWSDTTTDKVASSRTTADSFSALQRRGRSPPRHVVVAKNEHKATNKNNTYLSFESIKHRQHQEQHKSRVADLNIYRARSRSHNKERNDAALVSRTRTHSARSGRSDSERNGELVTGSAALTKHEIVARRRQEIFAQREDHLRLKQIQKDQRTQQALQHSLGYMNESKSSQNSMLIKMAPKVHRDVSSHSQQPRSTSSTTRRREDSLQRIRQMTKSYEMKIRNGNGTGNEGNRSASARSANNPIGHKWIR